MMGLDEQATPGCLAGWLGDHDDWTADEDAKTQARQDALPKHLRSYVAEAALHREKMGTEARLLEMTPKAMDREGSHSVYGEADVSRYAKGIEQHKTEAEKWRQASAEHAKDELPQMPAWPGLQVTRNEWERPVMSGTYT